jgi:hypothetical protein
LIAEPYFSSSVIFIVHDEAYETPGGAENITGYDGIEGGPVYMTAVSPYTEGVGALPFDSSHHELLSTMEWLLGLPVVRRPAQGTEIEAEAAGYPFPAPPKQAESGRERGGSGWALLQCGSRSEPGTTV